MQMEFQASYHQERLWFIDEFEAGNLYESSPVYHNIALIFRISGVINKVVLEKSIAAVIKRHEALRTRIITKDNQPFQAIQSEVAFKLEQLDPTGDCNQDDYNHAFNLAIDFVKQPFKMDKESLIRGQLMRLAENRYMLALSIHHIISDRYSLKIIANEIFLNYNMLLNGGTSNLPGLAAQYADFSCWQRGLSDDMLEPVLFYWKRKLKGKIRALELPTDNPRTAVHIYHDGRREFLLDQRLLDKIATFCVQRKTGRPIVLLAAFKLLLYKYSNQDEIVVGMSENNRNQPGLEYIVGPIANLLVLRSFFEGSFTFLKTLDKLSQTLAEARKYKDIPFEKLDLEIKPAKDMSRTVFFDVLFQYEEKWEEDFSIDGLDLDIEVLETNLGLGKYDLNLLFREGKDSISGYLVYNRDYYREAAIERFIIHYMKLLENLLENPDREISTLYFLTDEEENILLYEFNDTAAGYPGDKTIHELFEQQAARRPDGAAVVSAEQLQVTYRELNKRSGQLSMVLRERGVLADDIVAIMMERSIEMIIGILGILKAGGAYLPIDPDYPRERIDYMLSDSAARVLLSTSTSTGEVEKLRSWEVKKVFLEEVLETPASSSQPLNLSTSQLLSSSNLAYIIYTSGTTGKPKGVMIEHGNVVRLFFNDRSLFDFGHRDVWTMFHSYCFDFSVWEMYGALLYGGKLIVIPGMVARDPEGFSEILSSEAVTVLNQTPSSFYHLTSVVLKAPGKSLAVRYLIFGGEALNPAKLKGWKTRYPGTRLINMYGITETTVHVTYKEITDEEIDRNMSNIGRPIPTLTTYVLDRYMKLVPIGVWGEVCVGGEGVGRGYLNRPKLTAEKFVYNPYKPGERLYRSGDMVRMKGNGEMEYLGRMDYQVKIRGFRIESGEVENRLLTYPGVDEAVVAARGDAEGEVYLCAYFTSKAPLDTAALKQHLGKELPEYMIPSYLVRLGKIPLTSNGKVDRKALPEPEASTKEEYTAPRNEIEKKLTVIWAEVLKQRVSAPIGIDDDFFELGGHSLKATLLAAKIHEAFSVKLPLEEIFRKPRIREQAEYINGRAKESYAAVEPVEEKEYYSLSSAQKRLYVLHQLASGSTNYNMPFVTGLEETVDKERLELAFKKLIARHESLRTSFERVDQEPVQRVHAPREIEFAVRYYDAKREEGSPEDIIESFIRPFDLSRAPLVRSVIIECPGGHYIWVVDMHHIVSDGTSQVVLRRDFMSLYNREELEALRLQYKDFSLWQNRLFASGVIKVQEDYWMRLYADIDDIPRLHLAADYRRPEVFTFAGDQYCFVLDRADVEKFKTLGSKNGGTLYMNILTVLNTLFYKYTGQTDIIIGSLVAGRPHVDLQHIIGMFINTIAMRNHPQAGKTYQAFLKEVITNSIRAFENQDIQFEELVEKLEPERDLSRNPLFDISMVVQNLEGIGEGAELPVVDGENQYANKISKFDITFFIFERDEDIFITIEYYTAVFKEETIQRLASHFMNVIKAVVTDPLIELKGIEVMSEVERDQVLHTFNDTAGGYPKDKTIHRLFEEQAARTPDSVSAEGIRYDTVAVGKEMRHGETVQITYRELNRESGQLAYLLKKKGVKPDTIVGIMMERSIEMIIGILGILKAGGAYLPIDPEYPQERIEYILKDSGARFLLSDFSKVGEGTENVRLSELSEEHLTHPTHLCYIIYTSGTTGKPKGVAVEHKNAVNVLHHLEELYPVLSDDAYLLKTNYTFDVSVTELFGWFFGKGRLIVLEKGREKEPESILETLRRYRVTHVNFVPSMFNIFVGVLNEQTFCKLLSLRYIFVAGEELSPGVVQKFDELKSRVVLENIYGPTEAAVYASKYSLAGWDGREKVPIGKPLHNMYLYILDKYDHIQGIGIPGELWIAGVGVSRGYLNRPDLTAEKFIYWSYRTYRTYISKKIYKTGDLARWLPDGNIEFLGRIDHQVKIRGLRIELGEIESILRKNEDIKEVVVVAKEDESGDKYLCAYMLTSIGAEERLNASELKAYLSAELPDYMIPSYFVPVEKYPLAPSGKIDRKRLPEPEIKKEENYIAPRNSLEEKLVEIWREVLGVEKDVIGIDSNFFELGGHSIKAIVLVSRIHRELEVKVPLTEVFKRRSIRGLAGYIEQSGESKYDDIEPVEEKEYYEISSSQNQFYVMQQLAPQATTYNLPAILKLKGRMKVEGLDWTLQRLLQRHEALRTSFEMVNKEPVQKVQGKVEFKIEYISVERKAESVEQRELNEGLHAPRAMRDAVSCADIIEGFVRPFDLSRAPLLRVGLIRLNENSHIFMVDMHHILSDFLSQGILIREIIALYSGGSLPELKLQYKDYSLWQNRQLLSGKIKKQEEYWLRRFAGDIPELKIPTDFPRPRVKSFEGSGKGFELNREVARRLMLRAREKNATLFMMYLAVTYVLLYKLGGQEDIVIGTIMAGRQHPHLENIIGPFINTLALRNYPGGNKSFLEFFREVINNTLGAFDNQDYRFEKLVQKVMVDRDTSRNPLFDVVFAFGSREPGALPGISKPGEPGMDTTGLEAEPFEGQRKNTAKFDLILSGTNVEEQCFFTIEYSTKLFKEETIQRYISYFKEIAAAVAKDADILLKDIVISTDLSFAAVDVYDEQSEFEF